MKLKRTLTLILALVLIAGIAVGGTLAYFTWNAEATNTFVVGQGVDVENDNDLEPDFSQGNEYPIVPGVSYAKDPQVNLTANSIDAYVIFAIKDINNTVGEPAKTIVQYEINPALTNITEDIDNPLEGYTYYAAKVTSGNSIQLFTGGKGVNADGSELESLDGIVTINPALTGADLTAIGTSKPAIDIKAYAVQTTGFTSAAEAYNAADASGDFD